MKLTKTLSVFALFALLGFYGCKEKEGGGEAVAPAAESHEAAPAAPAAPAAESHEAAPSEATHAEPAAMPEGHEAAAPAAAEGAATHQEGGESAAEDVE